MQLLCVWCKITNNICKSRIFIDANYKYSVKSTQENRVSTQEIYLRSGYATQESLNVLR